MMSQENEMAIGFMLVFSENPDKILDSIHSQADVDHLIAERIECGISQKTEKLTKDPNDNIGNTSLQNYVNPVNYEPINLDTGLTQDSVYTVFEFIEGKVDNYYTEPPITEVQFLSIDECKTVELQDEPELWEPVEMLDTPTRLLDGQIIEEFILEEEEEIDFQGIDECRIVE